MKKMIFVTLLSFVSTTSFANQTVNYSQNDLKLKVELISEQSELPDIFSPEAYMNRDACLGREVDTGLDINALITLGEKIWDIVKNGAPVLEFTSNSVSAIPNGAVCPFNMSGWSLPQSKTYKLTYSNLFGSDVISFTYKVIYSFGGSYLSKGAYLTNVSVHPADIYVAWGQSFNASVNVAKTLNIGTADDPVAGMQIMLEWNVENPLNKFKSQRVYFVEGRGSIKEL